MSDPRFCRRCGTALKPGVRFCTACGGSLSDEAAGAAPAAASPSNELRWRVDVALITNRFIVRDVLLGCGITAAVTGVLFGVLFSMNGGGWKGAQAGLTFAGLMGLFILLVSVFTLVVVFGNRWPLEFVVCDEGVVQNNVSEKAHAIHRLSWILALVTGRPLMAGPGLIAQSREVVAIPWEEIRRVQRHPALGVIAIRGGFLDSVRLYCTSANYSDVAQRVEAAVRQHAPSAVIA
jgi:hypothetical protein